MNNREGFAVKRFVFLAVVLLVGTASAAIFWVDEDVRFRGTATPATNDVAIIVDSSDTFEIETYYSDTIAIDSMAKWLVGDYALTGYTACDSCNNSVLVIITGDTSYNGRFARTVMTDTLVTALDSTAVNTFWLSLDSIIANKFWFKTIVKDSVITTVRDTIRMEFNYRAGYKAVEAVYQ